jgi:hypothetical protein
MTKDEKRKLAERYIQYHFNSYDWDDLASFLSDYTGYLEDEDLLEIGDMIDYAKVKVTFV